MTDILHRSHGDVIHNVLDKHYQWIGSWVTAPLSYDALSESDIGRTVIYNGDPVVREVGVITSFKNGLVFARFHTGTTSAACDPNSLVFGIESIDRFHKNKKEI